MRRNPTSRVGLRHGVSGYGAPESRGPTEHTEARA